MPDRDEELKAFYRLLRQRQISGDVGRIQIADRLARMTLAELLRIPPWVIVRLGPERTCTASRAFGRHSRQERWLAACC